MHRCNLWRRGAGNTRDKLPDVHKDFVRRATFAAPLLRQSHAKRFGSFPQPTFARMHFLPAVRAALQALLQVQGRKLRQKLPARSVIDDAVALKLRLGGRSGGGNCLLMTEYCFGTICAPVC